MGDGEVFAGGVQHGVLDVGREADGVNDGVDGRKGFPDLRKSGINLSILAHVALDQLATVLLAKLGQELLGVLAQALGLVAEHKGRAGLGEGFCDGVGDAALVGNAEDDGHLALHVDHGCDVLLGRDLCTAMCWGRRKG